MPWPRTLVPAFVLLVAPAASPQGAVGPGVVGPPSMAAVLNPPSVPAASVMQVQLVEMPGSLPGFYACSLTVTGLPPAHGGQGDWDLLLGTYDAARGRFVPDLGAAACNSTGREFGGMLDPSGLHYVFERPTSKGSTVMHARRTSVKAPFSPPVAVIGLPPQSSYDPALGLVEGRTSLFYAREGSVCYALFDVEQSRVAGPTVAAVRGSAAGGSAHSPSPITDKQGNVTGLLHHDALGSDSDLYLTLDLDPATPSHLVLDTPTWLNNGGFAGGTFFSAESAPAPYHVIDLETVWMTGAQARIGERAALDFYVSPKMAGAGAASVLFMSSGFMPLGLPIPGIRNLLGLDPGGLFPPLSVGGHDLRSGRARFELPIPPRSEFLGLELPVQGVTLAGAAVTLGNTATLRVGDELPQRALSLPYDGLDHVLSTAIDPARPAMRVEAAASNAAPFSLLALDAFGQQIGDPAVVYPGLANSLSQLGAARYVARMPLASSANPAAVVVQDGARWVEAQWERTCDTRKHYLSLGDGSTARCVVVRAEIEVREQGKAPEWKASECPIGWSYIRTDHNGRPLGNDPYIRDGMGFVIGGWADPSMKDKASRKCVPLEAGFVGIEYSCEGRSGICRVRIEHKEVKDCKDCKW